MKYPQLVSPRAVNAISDWLVSRLEQLGVESPQIYTRLLLSLLQSSVQVNDPIEFSNLEAFFASRKGGHRRFHLPSDTETLKKLNAVQCLREIVSNEQETATIEHLVEELCEKLKDIERQTQDLNDEQQFLIESNLNNDSLLQAQINLQLQQQQQQQQQHQQPSTSSINNQHNSRHHQHHQHQHHHNNNSNSNSNHQQLPSSHICNNSHNTTLSHNNNNNNSGDSKHYNASATTATTTADAVNDIDNDPKNRYFRAFPALSKEMEESFRIWRRNAKSFTWPIVGRSIQGVENCNNNNNNNNSNSNSASLSSSSASSIISTSNFNISLTNSADKSFDKKIKAEGGLSIHPPNQLVNKVSAETASIHTTSGDVEQHQAVGAVVSAKKKSKRRRNQALCKGKNIQSVRKLSAVGNTSNSVGSNKYHHYSHHRNTSPAWDTDFKGCWEMGPDLIKEFLTRQNSNKRNRSDSNSMDQEEQIERKISNEMSSELDKPIMKRYIDLSFCCDDDDDDDNNTHQLYSEEGVDYVDTDYDDNTLTSISELAMDSMNPKRLYQREGHLQKLMVGNVLVGNTESDNTIDGASDSVDPIDFQQFKAKFNSSVEALWKDADSSNSVNVQPATENSLKVNNSADTSTGISSNFYATTSLNALAPFKKDLWNFWSNYNQQQHYDQKLGNKLSTTASSSSMINTRVEDSSASSGIGADIANSSDYFSMPSNLDDFDKSVGGVRRANDAAASLDAHTPSINVFLQNSIWSTSGDCVDAIGGGTSSTADTDESFLIKVWHSNKKLSQLDVGHAISGEKMPTTLTSSTDGGGGGELDYIKSKESSILNNPNLGANLQFPPYQNLKWSEGINAGPACNSLHSNANNVPNTSTLRDENNYGNFSSAANISGATWEAPAYGQNAQPDLKSWCASNPMSLTEMYGSDVCDSIVNQPSSEDSEENPADVNIGPAVTLPNHSVSSSGFVAYARVKQCGIVKPQTKPLQTSSALRLPKDFFKSGEEENLLTSERTHFRPIENFVDGHTFEISNALDSVDFERTESGLLYYDSEEYLEYTRNDIYMADEEVSTSSTNLLKYGKKSSEDKSDMFVIKFRVRRSEETACQTEEKDFELAAAKMTEISTTATLSEPTYFSRGEVNNMFHNTFSLSRQANNEAIMAAVTKAVAAAAKAAAENHLNSSGYCSWLHPPTHTSTAVTSRNCTLENNPIWLVSDPSVCDEVDFCKANSLNPNLNYGSTVETTDVNSLEQQQQLAQNWSMQEVEKQCHQRRYLPQMPQEHQHELKRKFPTSVDVERTEENSLDNTSLHTLWGMCAACNSCEYGKSMPANRLLRDELQLEADEIMSDLRYMQDLYIGETNVVTEANENNAEDMEDNDNKIEKEEDCKFMKNPWNADNDNVQVSMLQKVNRLIEDLLKPDNAVKLPIETQSYDKLNKEIGQNNVWNLQNENAEAKNLWQYGEENVNIWKHKSSMEQQDGKPIEQSEAIIKPMKLLKQVGSSLTEDPQYMDTLNWKHENLAKIWQEEGTLSTTKDMENEQQSQHDEINNEQICEELQTEEEEELSKGSQKLVEEKNLRNLQSINALTPPTSVAACHTYERVQHFLNNSAAKLKLAANRKRRHSASQNFYQQQQQQHLNYTNNGNNNNNDNITDLNVYKQQLNDALKDTKEHQQQHQQQQQQQQQQQLNATPYKIDTKNNNFDEQPKRQTIITCKYWTTATNGTQSSLDSAAAAMMLLAAATKVNSNADTIYDGDDVMLDENIFGNTFSCLIDKNASILKHMTMMTRPLTR